MTEVERLAAEVARLSRHVEALSAALASTQAQTIAKGMPEPAQIVLHERRRYHFEAKLPAVRKVIDYRSENTTTGAIVSADKFSARQIQRFALQFARLPFPSRKHWKGDRDAYALMRELFAQHSAIQKHGTSRVWRWCAWPHIRREIAGKIIASLTHPSSSKSAK